LTRAASSRPIFNRWGVPLTHSHSSNVDSGAGPASREISHGRHQQNAGGAVFYAADEHQVPVHGTQDVGVLPRARIVNQSTGAAAREIGDIWKDINEDPRRPVNARNAHANMKWWLEQHFPSLRFEYLQTHREDTALESIIRFINNDFPVLVSVSHARVAGHIILVTGYANYQPGMSSQDFELIVHDPYGRFDPWLLSSVLAPSGGPAA